MTKQDYIKFARMFAARRAVINNMVIDGEQGKNIRAVELAVRQGIELDNIIRLTADIFQADNPNFNRHKFYDACGLKE